ncbi:hypothetical protein COY27_02205 [Candidatus Woesearchaeota archaeon CG_4_10_14_0_2_um_filter_33_13]|nr:MAG: hypothetical protein COY27_02205 [Candidatus Woesearchaeota archaeon CG_4_10_14_0_2_um_filter_33_13]
MRGKTVLCVALFVLVMFSTLALAESTVEVTTIKNLISMSEKAEFSLKITNNAETKQRYSVYSFQSGQGWNVDPYPLKDKIIEVAAGKTYTTMIRAQPTESFTPGIYYVHITVESDNGERFNKALKVYLGPEKPVDYLPSIKVVIDMNDKINPQEIVPIKLFLENNNPLDLTNLKIKVQSDMPEFEKEVMVDLPPLEKKTVEFSVKPNSFQQPKDYVLFFVFEKNGEVAKIIEQKVEVLSLVPGFATNVIEEIVFLKKFTQVDIKNEGNTINSQEVKIPISFFSSLFVTDTEGDVKNIEGKRYLTWEVSLNPDETIALNYVVNYRVLFYLFVILALFGFFYWYVQTPIFINKTAQTTKAIEDGSLSEIKVTLEIKNKSNKILKDVNITDKVPGIANVEKSLELGTLRPKEVKHGKQGTTVVWNLAELDAQEHRLITYKVKAKLNIVGTFSLPRAEVEFAKKGKRKGKAYSNIFRISS